MKIRGWRDGRKGPCVRKHSWSPEAEKGKRTEGPSESPEEPPGYSPVRLTLDLQNWKITNLCYFKPPSWW